MKTNFTKGINTNAHPSNTPLGYYTDAVNMRVSGDAKRSEEGTAKMNMVPSNFVQWGSCAIGDQTILLGTIDGKSVIGSLNKQTVWVTEVPARAGLDVLLINSHTQVEGKKNWIGERVIYFSTSAGARRVNLDIDLPTDDTEFDKVTSLFLEYDLPIATYSRQDSTGQLTSGVYQAHVRLVTESLAPTPFGLGSAIVSVVRQPFTSPRDTINGNPVGTTTNKSITFTLTNIDTAFKYIQLGFLTYVGVANVPVFTATNLIVINGLSTITYVYRGEPDNLMTLPIEEAITSGTAYSTGEFFTQKDGTLLIGNPTEADKPDIDWYRVAQGITSKYVVKRFPHAEALAFDTKTYGPDDKEVNTVETSSNPIGQTYKNANTIAKYKGYRRQEVYSFTLTPVFTSGVHGPTVHIPANDATSTDPTVEADPNDGGLLGTYMSEELYPDERYPGLFGTSLRLHKFPDAVQQPVIDGNVDTGNLHVRVLGVKFENIVLDPSETHLAKNIAGYIIGRVDRRGNETQLSQGIVRHNTDYKYNDNSAFGQTIGIGDGLMKWQMDISAGGTATQCRTWNLIKDDFTFLAPDIIHGTHTPYMASHIMQHASYEMNPYACNMEYYSWDMPDRDDFARHKCFFDNVTGPSTQVLDRSERLLDGEILEVAPFGVPNAAQASGGKIEYTFKRGAHSVTMCSSNGFTWLGTTGDVPFFKDHDYEFDGEHRVGQDTKWDFFDYIHNNAADYRRTFVVHSLTRQDPKQYGALDQMVSMFVHYEVWDTHDSSTTFWNGDTFITKYGLTVSDESPFPYNPDDNSDSPNKVGRLKPINANGIIYFWIESDNNYDYRHFIPSTVYTEANIDGGTGSVPYFPEYKQLQAYKPPFGLLTMHSENWERPGYCSTYNTQYSTQPTLKPYAITPFEDTQQIKALSNRVIFSTTAVQGEKADAYQIFLPNNFYDVPQEFGDLTDVYTNGELYACTAQAQWKLFYNTLVTQATSVGEVVLGTGGAFNRPAVPMTTVTGGYGGTAHWRHGVNTVFGRVFLDSRQGKFFIQQETLADFSGTLSDRLRVDIMAQADTLMFVGSEPMRERVFLNLSGEVWSFNLEHKVFVSRHTMNPRWFFSHGPHLYSNQTDIKNGETGIFKHSLGTAGTYYGKRENSSITIVANAENTVSKLFQNLEIYCKVGSTKKHGNINDPFATFTQMEIFNAERNTGVIDITTKMRMFQSTAPMEVLASKVRDCFRILLPRDIVINPENDIFATSNHAQQRWDRALTKWLPKMRGTYIEIKLITDNSKGAMFIYDVNVGVSENTR